ncbi:MAG: glycosyltransferase [Alphaproteobacteria bacterium]
MRIMIISSIYLPMAGGLPLFSHRLAFYLQQKGHIVKIIAPSETIFSQPRNIDGVNIMGMASVKSYLYKNFRLTIAFGLYQKLKKEILSFKPDVIHIQGHYANERRAVSIAKKYNIPLIATNHTAFESVAKLMPFSYFKPWSWLVEKLFWQRIFATFKLVTIVTAPSQAAKKILHHHGLKIPTLVISNGLDIKIFHPKKSNPTLRKKYKLPDGLLLLSVSRLDKEKELSFAMAGVAIAIKKNLANKKPPFHFFIVGEGDELKNLQQQAKKTGIADYVHFLGRLNNTLGTESDLPNLYATADSFITASPMEIQGISVMEAMASGLPIIAANRRALPELVSHKKNGVLFTLDDVDKLADKILYIMNNQHIRKKMAEQSLKKIRPHDIHAVIKKFESVYRTAIKQHNKKIS